MTFQNVSKNLLLNSLNSGLHTGCLTIGDFPLRDELTLELEAFEAKVGKTGRTSIQGGTKAGHSDIAMAAAMAYYLSDHRTVGAHVGEVKLNGYW
ncbi:hypothetical protein [Shimia sp.]|uniref:hypothetical protein n=1 Tax=Shimia sp. TaxID=1954381 RepID=UPI00329804E5